jgi:uncharacterized protein YjbJ (UPF0337 family)
MINFPVQYPQGRVFRNRVVQETQAKKFFLPAAIGRNSQSSIKESNMNWICIEGNWKQFKGNIKKQWSKFTDDQLDVIAGKRDYLAGKIQESYGVSKGEAEKQLAAWQERQKEWNTPNDIAWGREPSAMHH